MKSFLLAVSIVATLPTVASAQLRPGDLLFTTPPNGNTVSAYRTDGTLIGQSDGAFGDWWIGQTLLPDLGWATLSLDIAVMPAGWYMLRFDATGAPVSSTYLYEAAELGDISRTADDVLLITDSSRGRVHRYTLDGIFIDYIDYIDFAATGFSPHRVCTLDDGTFWIFDTGYRIPVSRAAADRSSKVPFWRGPGEDWHRPAPVPLLPFSFSQDELTADRAPRCITGPGGSGRSSSPDRRAGFPSCVEKKILRSGIAAPEGSSA